MILVFWHVCQVGCWERIYTQQWIKLKLSGLYDAADKIYVSLVGSEDGDRGPTEFPKEIINDPKVVFKTNGSRYEFEYPTIAWAQEIAKQTTEPTYVCYFHTKGAMTANHFIQNGAYWWGEYMAHYTLQRWRDNVAKLKEGFDITGVEWRTSPDPHFSGNFWWATADYLKRSPDVMEYRDRYKKDRMYAEMFIGASQPRYHSFKHTGQDLYRYCCTPDQWN